jgi:hypothetical protein
MIALFELKKGFIFVIGGENFDCEKNKDYGQ